MDAQLHGFDRDDLSDIADSLMNFYPQTVNVGPVSLPDVDEHIESTTAAAARFIRASLASGSKEPL
jgi:hypothetical protein